MSFFILQVDIFILFHNIYHYKIVHEVSLDFLGHAYASGIC